MSGTASTVSGSIFFGGLFVFGAAAKDRVVCFISEVEDRPNKQRKQNERLLFLLGLAWAEEDLVDVRDNTSGSDGDVGEKLVQFLIVPDGEHDVPWGDPSLLVVAGSVTGKFENFDSQILKDSGHEDWGTGTDTVAITALTEESVKSTDWELKAGPGGPGLWVLAFAIDSGLGSGLLNTFLGWH